VSELWPKVKLGEVLRRIERLERPAAGKTYRQLGVRLWGQGAYERESMDGASTRYAVLARVETSDIVVNKIWARNGSVAVVQPELTGCFVSGEFPTFELIPGKVIPRWIHWLTKTPAFWEQCDERSRGTSGKNRIKPEQFLKVEAAVPALAEQQRIVARIEELAIKIAEARSLRQEAAGEAETLARASVERSYRDLGARVGYSRLMDVCETITDGDHVTPQFSPTGVCFIFVGNVSMGHLHFQGSKRVSEEYFKSLRPQRVPKRGDVLYSAVGATLGVPTIVNTDEPFCFQRHIAILKPDHRKIKSRFLWHMLRSRTIFDRTWSSTTGTAQPTVPLRAIRELPIPLPSLAEQREGVAYLDRLQTNVDVLKKLQAQTAAELNALMPSILDKAFKGEL
jgi:type I restriction enzyme S subunit